VPVTDRLHQIVSFRTPSRPVGVARIGLGCAAVAKAVLVFGSLPEILGPDSLRLPTIASLPTLSPHILRWGLLVAAASFLIGYRTRASGMLLSGLLFYVLLLDQRLYSNHLYLMALLVLLLSLADAGASLSLDAIRRGAREMVPAWPVTLAKLQISIVYGYAALAKINAMYVYGPAGDPSPQALVTLPSSLRVPAFFTLVAVLSILIESFLAGALWSKRLLPAAVVTGISLHLAMVAFMDVPVEIAIFGLEALAVYVLFLGVPARPIEAPASSITALASLSSGPSATNADVDRRTYGVESAIMHVDGRANADG
jgi:hypothetical protein